MSYSQFKKTIFLPLYVAVAITAVTLVYNAPADYYTGIEGLQGEELKAALHEIIKGHKKFSYSSNSTDTWDILTVSDRDPNNSNNVYLVYTGNSLNGPAEYNSGRGWNREHIWPQSLGGFGTNQGPGTDVHNLRASNIRINSSRSNKEFDNGGVSITVDNATETYADEDSFEPNDNFKGDVARVIFYMAVRYEGYDGEPDLEIDDLTDGSVYTFGKLSTLLAWHILAPVDDFEIRRNEIIYSFQLNRNPFIDRPELVAAIFDPNYSSLVEIFKECTTSFEDNKFVYRFLGRTDYDYIVVKTSKINRPYIFAPDIDVVLSVNKPVPPQGYKYMEFSVLIEGNNYFKVRATSK